MNNVGQVFWPHNCAAKSQPSGKLLESKRRASQEECHLDRAPAVPGSVPARSPDRPGKRPGSSAGRPGANLNLQTCTCKPALPWTETVETVFCTIEAVATKKVTKSAWEQTCTYKPALPWTKTLQKLDIRDPRKAPVCILAGFVGFFRCDSFHAPSNLSLQTCTCKPGLAKLDLQTWTGPAE